MKPLPLLMIALALATLVSALAVVYAQHESRKLFVELRALEMARDEMDIDWGRLQLEQSTWATHGRVEELARERLQMLIPQYDRVVVVRVGKGESAQNAVALGGAHE